MQRDWKADRIGTLQQVNFRISSHQWTSNFGLTVLVVPASCSANEEIALKSKWISFRVLMFFFLVACTRDSKAELPKHPESLASENAVAYVEINDVGRLILNTKKYWLDVYYRDAVSSNRLEPLALPIDSVARRLSLHGREFEVDPSASHWLANVLDAVSIDTHVVRKIKSTGRMLQKEEEWDASMEDELVDSIASLFPGGAFVALEHSEGYMKCIFGIEYDPGKFDLTSELQAAARKQRQKGPVRVDSGVEIWYLPADGMHFFAINNVVYGAYEDKPKECLRILKKLNQERQVKDGLAEVKSFKRSILGLPPKHRQKADVIIYMDFSRGSFKTFGMVRTSVIVVS